jgi:hypothetical protein
MTVAMGIPNVYLMSDNLTVIETAAREFPEFQWFTQRRPIKVHGTFDVKNEVCDCVCVCI